MVFGSETISGVWLAIEEKFSRFGQRTSTEDDAMVGADSDDNTTPGITCARARMKPLFTSKYQTVLPTEAELAAT